MTSTIVTSVLTPKYIPPGLLDLSELKDVGESMSEIALDLRLAQVARILPCGSDFMLMSDIYSRHVSPDMLENF